MDVWLWHMPNDAVIGGENMVSHSETVVLWCNVSQHQSTHPRTAARLVAVSYLLSGGPNADGARAPYGFPSK